MSHLHQLDREALSPFCTRKITTPETTMCLLYLTELFGYHTFHEPSPSKSCCGQDRIISHCTESIMNSSHSHSFNHGWQNAVTSHMLLLAVAVLIIFHPAQRQPHSLANHHIDQLPSAGRPLSYRRLPTAFTRKHCRRLEAVSAANNCSRWVSYMIHDFSVDEIEQQLWPSTVEAGAIQIGLSPRKVAINELALEKLKVFGSKLMAFGSPTVWGSVLCYGLRIDPAFST